MAGGQAVQVDFGAVLADDVDRGDRNLFGLQLLRQRAVVVRQRIGREQSDHLVLAEIGVGEFDVGEREGIAVERLERETVDRDVAGERPVGRASNVVASNAAPADHAKNPRPRAGARRLDFSAISNCPPPAVPPNATVGSQEDIAQAERFGNAPDLGAKTRLGIAR